MKKMNWKIVADENIPFVEELFGIFGEVRLHAGRNISKTEVVDADVLLVRSVTQVNRALLENTRVKFVGTCTIGTDHLDIAWLTKNNIAWASAPGCNAMAVVQYVLSSLAALQLLEQPIKVAIVGCGNVGGQVYKTLKALGKDCVGIDPFKNKQEFPDIVDFEGIYDCDVVCLHTPLTRSGSHPTFHMIDETVLRKLKSGSLLLNAGRGAVIDNSALLKVLRQGGSLNVVLDVWEPEPAINTELFERVTLGTPHIAGYSYEGKINGSLMIFDALVNHAKKTPGLEEVEFVAVKEGVVQKAYGEPETIQAASFSAAVLLTYDVREDHRLLQNEISHLPASFDLLRKHYRMRREPAHYRLGIENINRNDALALGFHPVSGFPAAEIK